MKLTNEEVQEIVARAEDHYEMLKDRVHDLYDENIKLKNTINKAIEYIQEQRSKIFFEIDFKYLLDILKGVDNE